MLLIQAEIEGETYRISRRGNALDYYWDAQVLGFDAIRFSMQYDYGGWCKPEYGSISLNQELFSSHWPPPATCSFVVYHTTTSEVSNQTLFDGIGHISNFNRNEVKYDLYGKNTSAATVTLGTSFVSGLSEIFTWACGASFLNLDYVDTYARSSATHVIYTIEHDRLITDFLSELAAYHTHIFYISGSTLYLIDMEQDNGSRTITEFDYFPSEYTYREPVGLWLAGQSTSYSTLYPYGKTVTVEAYHTNEGSSGSSVYIALGKINTIYHRPVCNLSMPVTGTIPAIGEQITFSDTSQESDVTMVMNCRSLIYDFDNETIVVEGEGTLT